MNGYQQAISEATGYHSEAVLEVIEDTMRHEVFGGGCLDGFSKGELMRAARKAAKMLGLPGPAWCRGCGVEAQYFGLGTGIFNYRPILKAMS